MYMRYTQGPNEEYVFFFSQDYVLTRYLRIK